MRFKKIIVLMVLPFLFGCGNSQGSTTEEEPSIDVGKVSSLIIDTPSESGKLYLAKENDSVKILFHVSPSTAVDKTATFESLNENIAGVNEEGVVTPVATGKTQIKITANGNTNIFKLFDIEVIPEVSSLTVLFGEEKYKMIEGKTITFPQPEFIPEEPFDNSVTWKSSDSSVVSIDENGKAIAIKEGEVTITATSNENKAVSDSIIIEVAASSSTDKPILSESLSSGFTIDKNTIEEASCTEEEPTISSTQKFLFFDPRYNAKDFVISFDATNIQGDNSNYMEFAFIVEDLERQHQLDFVYSLFDNHSFKAETGYGDNDRKDSSAGHNFYSGMMRSDCLNTFNTSIVNLKFVRHGNDYYYFVNNKLVYSMDQNKTFDNVTTRLIFRTQWLKAEYSNFSASYKVDDVTSVLNNVSRISPWNFEQYYDDGKGHYDDWGLQDASHIVTSVDSDLLTYTGNWNGVAGNEQLLYALNTMFFGDFEITFDIKISNWKDTTNDFRLRWGFLQHFKVETNGAKLGINNLDDGNTPYLIGLSNKNDDTISGIWSGLWSDSIYQAESKLFSKEWNTLTVKRVIENGSAKFTYTINDFSFEMSECGLIGEVIPCFHSCGINFELKNVFVIK